MPTDLTDDRIEFRQYVAVLRRQRWLVVAVTFLAVLVALTYALLAPAVYEATAKVLVQPQASSSSPSAAQATSMDTEREILRSEAVGELAGERLGWTGSVPDLLERVSADVPPETLVLEVSFSAEDPRSAARGAEAFAQAYLEFRADQANRSYNAFFQAQAQRQTSLNEQLEEAEAQLDRYPEGSARYIQAQNRRDLLLAELAG